MITTRELLRFDLFSFLSREEVSLFLPHLQERRCRKGHILFVEGEIGSVVYFVLHGQVKLSKMTPDGEEQILDWCGPYDSFAETLLLESGSYPATAEVVRDGTLLVLNNEIMPALLEEHPRLAVALVRILSKRLRLAQEFIRILTSKSTAGTLASLLLRLARPASAPDAPIYIQPGLTHRDLAGMIGTSREVVNRSLSAWKKSGIIRPTAEKLEILKPQELADWP
ncbi:RmlC-like jelly roll fold [Acididesulfobacillus acetoxydans]|uniref:RmlC-like jelly roll fold n=1 Tax=Acididesulfobacillus acetoxydans TaxID=1561005 RepID=A0A8S0XBB3_9FIRM|nr:Crp/Fnr family transcriptional regulator [Acididesulfobacillus acetoxydans]CAA7601006.1 RmlC-like jelly roll fold [Acididesulfobacillus acetoxydans]CEJ06880.1 cAMP-binding protein [Acididesulfobacillus acetoxydans]